MDKSAPKIFFLFLVTVFWVPEVCSKNSRIKIIVPHKISIIHHHHSKIMDLKPKKELHFDHDNSHSNQIHHQGEESEEDVSKEGRIGHGVDEHDEASQRGVAFYSIPASQYSNLVRVFMKPVLLYNEAFYRRHPPPYEYHGYEDFNYPEETYQENMYRFRGFQNK